jgi:cytochrome c553
MTRLCLLLAWVVSIPFSNAAEANPADLEHFEKSVRPILVQHCYRCHSADAKNPKGGLRVDGRAFLLAGGDNGASIVPGAPEKSLLMEAVKYGNSELLMPPKEKLAEGQIRDLERWIKAGAPWPKDGNAIEGPKTDFDIAKRKAEHWVWKPIAKPAVPAGNGNPVDRFIQAKLSEMKLTPAGPAEKAVWLRRVSFALTGLPPTPAEIESFEKDNSGNAHEKVVDRLLASPAFGERWARHWLDLVRYGETRGHEFDPDIPNAYQYRDYVVRALNDDVPYDQFLKEQIAGDTLAAARLNPKSGANESILGTGFWHLGEEVHSPVDIRQDQADRYDNRIDVLTKTFLGLTVSCARCHDHKFDAISAKDYYALFALLEGSAYRQVRFDGQTENQTVAKELQKLRVQVSEAVAKASPPRKNEAAPSRVYQDWRKQARVVVDYSAADAPFIPDDVSFGSAPRAAGSFSIRPNGTVRMEDRTAAVFDRYWAGLKAAPGSANDHGALGRTTRAGFTIRTPSFLIEKKALHYLVRGGGFAFANVDGHTIVNGPLHGKTINAIPNSAGYRWITHRLDGYVGQRAHLELTADPNTEFAVAMVVQSDDPPPGVPPAEFLEGEAPNEAFVSNWLDRQSDVEKELQTRTVWASRLAPALWDGNSVNSYVFIRGNPKAVGELVPPRNLEALTGAEKIAHRSGSGRREFAEQLVGPGLRNFTARVYVNRVWHNLFGVGLVPTTDNFGVLGELPSHPELLDYLACDFGENGWSTKSLIRQLVLTDVYRRTSKPVPESLAADPVNKSLHAFRVKRLEGEAIRDAMLRISGRLNPAVGGKSVPIYLTPFLDGRGKPVSGPLDGDGRRSLYLAVRRNFLSPFLQAFDTPSPFSSVGRRQVSNVPAQALILLNDPFVHQQADLWAKEVLARNASTDERLTGMYLSAFGRKPQADELKQMQRFLIEQEDEAKAWNDLAHSLFNVKEFIFIK